MRGCRGYRSQCCTPLPCEDWRCSRYTFRSGLDVADAQRQQAAHRSGGIVFVSAICTLLWADEDGLLVIWTFCLCMCPQPVLPCPCPFPDLCDSQIISVLGLWLSIIQQSDFQCRSLHLQHSPVNCVTCGVGVCSSAPFKPDLPSPDGIEDRQHPSVPTLVHVTSFYAPQHFSTHLVVGRRRGVALKMLDVEHVRNIASASFDVRSK